MTKTTATQTTATEPIAIERPASAPVEIERYRAACAQVDQLTPRTPAYKAAVQKRNLIRKIAATAVRATLRSISPARAREIVLFVADGHATTISDAAIQLSYRSC